MRQIHSNSMVGLWLCVAALALAPACSGSNGGVSTGTSLALTNNLDDDVDGKVDEAGEGDDEDSDGTVDEANEDADGCAMQAAAAGAPAPAAVAPVADDADGEMDEADGEHEHHDSNDDCDDEEDGEKDD
jgi:hypothetical protein